ncbi:MULTISPECIES: putative metalloprotease CJM1_0395 family protein [unclassified Fusibacter]|uniref:putative metalloprotease CJM1_0395 family protein n=1 Tax=unclassified Fusibacter TaxID=2624464 RepID=UPI0010129089|nr:MULTISPECIES: putative metalloprotease CJM1_0395 family protein [unclassified Fusibacter]MCK8059935.1 hypothetical protein [Fusibacter sp. A2]NPE22077.1 hypothetical protein [Fusibacter sp. A1]RXV60856.1 hypothetical protein DWB64_09540 [Fusibacter sp. A1]
MRIDTYKKNVNAYPNNPSDRDQRVQADRPIEKDVKNASGVESQTTTDDSKNRSVIRELVNREREVIAHERAHQSAGGDIAGSASYTYTIGPDGKRYISGGEVSLSIPGSDDPEEMIQIAQQVIKAAMAPVKPSSQDISVASRAQQMASQARMLLASKRYEAQKEDKKDNTVDLLL